MGIIENWNQYERRVGEAIGVSAKLASANNRVVASAVNTLCGISNVYPDKWVAPPYTRAWVKGACSAANLPSFPALASPPFEGGQCEGVTYIVQTRLKFASNTNGGNTRDDSPTYNVVGAVKDFIFEKGRILPSSQNSQFGAGNVQEWSVKLKVSSGDPLFLGVAFSEPGGSPEDSPNIIEVLDVTRQDGAADDCGNLQQEYPDSGTPNPDDYCTRVVYEDGTQTIFCANPDTPIGDEICFEGEEHTICLNGDGVSITPNDKIEKPEPTIDDLDTEEEEEVEEKEEEEDDTIEYVTTLITTPPVAYQTIAQKGEGNDDFFAGYFTWTTSRKDGAYRHPAIPIRKQRMIFKNPGHADGYKVYTVNEAVLRVTVYKKPPETSESSG